MKRYLFPRLLAIGCLATATSLQAVVLVQTSDSGFYNDSIGTLLNLTNGGETGMFPISNDGTFTYNTAPNLSAASSILGNWLTNPLSLNSNWTYETNIPNTWIPGTEVAVMYQFNTLGATNVVAKFGVDNGIFVWLDGNFVGGARAGGHPVPWEYQYNIGNLSAGTHFLQLLLEDHGGSNGYLVEITADTYTPGPPPSVPESGNVLVFGFALAFLGGLRRYLRR
jgi:hypothetical protein